MVLEVFSTVTTKKKKKALLEYTNQQQQQQQRQRDTKLKLCIDYTCCVEWCKDIDDGFVFFVSNLSPN